MLRYLFALAAAVLAVALITRARSVRRLLYAILGLMAIYAVLKLTGAIDAMAPDRTGTGVF